MSETEQSRPDARSSQLSVFLWVLAGLIGFVGWLALRFSFSLWQSVAGGALLLVAVGLVKVNQRSTRSK